MSLRFKPSGKTPQKKKNARKDDELSENKPFTGPEMLYGVLKISCNCNLKEFVEGLACDLEDSGFSIQWKQIQVKESRTDILISGVHPGSCLLGLSTQIRYAFRKTETKLIDKGSQLIEFRETEPREMCFSFRQQRQHGKASTREKRNTPVTVWPIIGKMGARC